MTTPDTLRALASRLRAGEVGGWLDLELQAAFNYRMPDDQIYAGLTCPPTPALSTCLADAFEMFDAKFADRWKSILIDRSDSKQCMLGRRYLGGNTPPSDAPTRCAALLIAMCEAAAMEMEAGDAEA